MRAFGKISLDTCIIFSRAILGRGVWCSTIIPTCTSAILLSIHKLIASSLVNNDRIILCKVLPVSYSNMGVDKKKSGGFLSEGDLMEE